MHRADIEKAFYNQLDPAGQFLHNAVFNLGLHYLLTIHQF